MSNELLIPFENLEKRGIQKEDLVQLNTSFFSTVYEQTFKLIDQIDKANERLKDKNSESQTFSDVQNIIAFTGRRGTGKTSSMLSVLDALTIKDLWKNKDYEKYGFVKKAFGTIPYTDASMLSENDDIVEIILSKMFSSLPNPFDGAYCLVKMQSKYEAQIQKIKTKLCEIYNHYSGMKKGKSESQGTSSNVMSRLADKYNVRQEFRKVIDLYNQLIADIQDKKKGYFVICIDDIDMTQQKHMNLVQCIHQYFMIPGIIVLLSTNFQLLTATLQKDYFNTVATSKSTEDEHNNQMYVTKKQTYDFLKKIISPDMRITMPSWRKKDYTELFPIKITLGKKDNTEKILKKFPDLEGSVLIKRLQNSEKEFTLQPKELIMLMLANRARVYLDIKGFKFHFMQPNSLRNLSDLFYMFYNMDNIQLLRKYKHSDNKEKEEKYFKKLENNRKILLDYLHFKILEEYSFNSEIKTFLENLLEEPMERRGRKIWDFYYKQISRDDNRQRIISLYDEKFFKNELEKFKVEKYSFGELYRILYTATRLGVFNRELVKFILASYSFSMPQFIEIEKDKRDKDKNKDEDKDENKNEDKDEEFIRTRNSFQFSLLGTWCKDIFGGKNVSVKINIKKFYNQVIHNNSKINYKKLEDITKDFIYLLCFYSRSIKNAVNVSYAKDITDYIVLDIKADPTSFVINSLRLRPRILKLNFKTEDENLKNIYENSNFTYPVLKLINTILNNKLPKNSITIEGKKFKDINEWFKSFIDEIGEDLICDDKMPWFILKHTDMAYNIIKRTVSEIIYESDNNLNLRDYVNEKPYMIMASFYQKLYNHLKEEDELYYLNNEDAEEKTEFSKTFSEILCNNPIASSFLEKNKNKWDDSENKHVGIFSFDWEQKTDNKKVAEMPQKRTIDIKCSGTNMKLSLENVIIEDVKESGESG